MAFWQKNKILILTAMTLKEIFDKLNNIAILQPEISEIIKTGNIYTLNEMRNAKYAVFCAVQDVHNYDAVNDIMNYRFNLYYIDRLTSDKSNKIEVQSTGIETLKNILKTIERESDEIELNSIEFNVFTDSFDGLCSGCYCSVTISVPTDGCVDVFESELDNCF